MAAVALLLLGGDVLVEVELELNAACGAPAPTPEAGEGALDAAAGVEKVEDAGGCILEDLQASIVVAVPATSSPQGRVKSTKVRKWEVRRKR